MYYYNFTSKIKDLEYITGCEGDSINISIYGGKIDELQRKKYGLKQLFHKATNQSGNFEFVKTLWRQMENIATKNCMSKFDTPENLLDMVCSSCNLFEKSSPAEYSRCTGNSDNQNKAKGSKDFYFRMQAHNPIAKLFLKMLSNNSVNSDAELIILLDFKYGRLVKSDYAKLQTTRDIYAKSAVNLTVLAILVCCGDEIGSKHIDYPDIDVVQQRHFIQLVSYILVNHVDSEVSKNLICDIFNAPSPKKRKRDENFITTVAERDLITIVPTTIVYDMVAQSYVFVVETVPTLKGIKFSDEMTLTSSEPYCLNENHLMRNRRTKEIVRVPCNTIGLTTKQREYFLQNLSI